MTYNCLVKINDTLLMAIGGQIGTTPMNSTYFYNSLTNQWTSGPVLNYPRTLHACGVLNWLNPATGATEQVVVVVGGAYISTLSSELLYQSNLSKWVVGPTAPAQMILPSLTSYNNGLILAGGRNDVASISSYTSLYKLTSPTGTWTVMSQTLKTSRFGQVAMLIPDNLATCA